MNVLEKNKVVIINNKRYYVFNMEEELPFLDQTTPYLFRYKNIEIIETSWSSMALKILDAIDKMLPKTEDELLSLKYPWSKAEPFSKVKKTNYTPYKNVFLDTNHTSTHSMMSIQFLLQSYNIDLHECYFLIRRHFIYEPEEVKTFVRNDTVEGFSRMLMSRGFEQKRVDTIIRNFAFFNKFLSKISSYNDFFLFDDYNMFTNYKTRTLEEIKNKTVLSDKEYAAIVRSLNYLDSFYKDKKYYEWLKNNEFSDDLLNTTISEIDYLFDSLKTEIIVASKIYSRMTFLYREKMLVLNNMNNLNDFYNLIKIKLQSKYYFKAPYISIREIKTLNSEQIALEYAYSLDEFTFSDIKKYISKMHLKEISSLSNFVEECADKYVQLDSDTMISMEKMNIDSVKSENIKNEILFYINSFGPINTETYNGYSSLPNLGYQWNKYLLVGIARTFLKNYVSVSSIGNKIKTQNYIIDIKR